MHSRTAKDNPEKNKKSNRKDHGKHSLKQGTRFDEACQLINDSLQKYISTHNVELQDDDGDVDGELAEDEILDKVFNSYSSEEKSGRIVQLKNAFQSGGLVCLVCIDNIKRNEKVWSCKSCYCSFHLDCIQKWGKDSLFLQAQAQEESLAYSNYNHTPRQELNWCCPKCRFSYPPSKVPSVYKCYCAKKIDPSVDPWLIPHSCGENCGKNLKPDCGHSCLLLCHPGPCPPCPATLKVTCHCQKQPPEMRRCSSKEWSCGSPCKKLLGCRQHKCSDPCHAGGCQPCPRLSNQKCNCGNSSQMRTCADPNWQCEKACKKQYSCGHHTCEKVCHSDTCGNCPLSGERTCPCGKSSHTLPCTETVPTCGDTCYKTLSCGLHICQERCHRGSCLSCTEFSTKRCLCGSREKEVACSKDFTCEVKCKKLRDCKKHACNKKCCTGDCPTCSHPCGKTLGCGNHKCESRCHPGRCYPCIVTHKVFCTCKKTHVTVPCGREKRTHLPKCSYECNKRPDCHHPKREPHRCHGGPCPPCKIICGTALPCSHKCPIICHDVVLVKLTNEKPAGPWEVRSTNQMVAKKLPHPPCMVNMPNTCLGKHETTEWACSELKPYSCKSVCGRKLSCSNHVCENECHIVDCEATDDGIAAGSNCATCQLPCSKPRPDGCSHLCSLSCHSVDCPPCSQMVKIKCHCGASYKSVICNEWLSASSSTRDLLRCCANQCNKQIKCGHNCLKQCHGGECDDPITLCRKKVAVRCPCKRLKKDLPCHSVTSGQSKVKCDAVCRQKDDDKKRLMEEEAKKKAEEEEKVRMKDYEEYQRFIEGGKKKRQRKIKLEVVEEIKWWKQKSVWIAGAVIILSGLGYFMLITSD